MMALQFSGVTCERVSDLSFTIAAGEIGVVRVASKEEKGTVLELAAGEKRPERGTVTLHGAGLDAAPGGSIAWLPEHGGMISNLKAWENLTLPLWYHGKRRPAAAEEKVRRWLAALGIAEDDMPGLMASAVGKLRSSERKLVGLARCLLQEPQLMVVDAGLFTGLGEERRSAWVAAMETFVRENEGRAIMVAADADHPLPWREVSHT